MICLIDGDIILYRSAWANNSKEDFYDVKRYVYELMFEILSNNNTTQYISYLTGKNNFRYQLAEKRDYKANRSVEKPRWFYEVRELLINELGFFNVDGMEADDALIITKKQMSDSVICTTDKDLLQIPGSFYNITKKHVITIDEQTAAENFWKQMLTGDVSDNIKCIHGIGPKGAEKILQGLKPSDMLHRVLNVYLNKLGEYEGIKYFHQNYRLLRLLDNHESFTIPDISKLDYLKPVESYVGKPKI